ncbi:MAG: Zn-ribbon domain-containing OB-fold protein [Promethearchaeota archaeon]
MTINIDELEEDIYVTKGMVRAEFNFWVGIPMEKFYVGLENKKFVGNKCPKCNKVFCPPRKICGDCFVECTEMVDLPDTGVVKSFTITPWKVQERKSRKVKKNIIAALVQIDGASNAMLVPLTNVEEDKVEDGMKVKVVWARRIKGHPADIKGFEPV